MIENNGLIDSNILIYSVDASEGAKHEAAKAFINRCLDSNVGFVSIQNLAEFHFNAVSRISSPILVSQSMTAVRLFSESFSVLAYDEQVILKAALLQQTYSIHFWDALLVATMQENNIFTIYTENEKDFEKVPGINVINPLK